MDFLRNYRAICLLLSFGGCNVFFAMHLADLKELPFAMQHGPIEGDVYIVPNKMIYAKSLWNSTYIEKQLNTKFQPDDVLVHVEATSEESEDWENGHPRIRGNFPTFLLYRMLKEKKEGDTLALQMLNESFVLSIRQLKHRYARLPFHVELEVLKNNFLKRPNFDLTALPKLLSEGILVEDPTQKGAEIEHDRYTHGPNGFKG